MAISHEKKTQIVTELENEFKNSSSVAFTSYRGATVAKISELRKILREMDVRFFIAKKTLIQLAAKNSGLPEFLTEETEPVAVVFSHEDELAGLQKIYEFSKKNKVIGLLGGFFDNETINKEKIIALAQLPNREALLGQFVGLLASPLRGIACVGNSLLSNFVRVLSEIQQKKEGSE
jgi:large subunit ribosomal protein L10